MLTQKQLTSIAITAFVTKMLVTFPTIMFRYCGNAAWLAGIYATVVGAGVFALIRKIYCTGENVITIAEKIGGTGLRIIVGIAVFVVLAANTVGLMRTFPEIIKLVLLQKTYVEIIGIVFLVALILCASWGIEGIARTIEIFIPIAGAVFAGFLIMITPQIHGEYLFPILGNGLKNIFFNGLECLSIFADILMINILIPYTNDLENYKKSGTNGIIIGGVCAIFIFLAYGLCYAYPATEQFVIPIYQMERLINLSDFFSRLESLFRFVWSIMILLYMCLYAAVLSEVWTQTFYLPHSKPIISPITIILACIAVIPQSLEDMVVWEANINKWIYIPALLLPLIIGGIYKMFHVKHWKGNNKW